MRRRPTKAPSRTAEDQASWTSVFTDCLRSMDPVLRFTTEIRVIWRRASVTVPANRHTAPRLVRREIEKAAERCDVLRPGAAEQDITAAIQAQLPLAAEGVVVTEVHHRGGRRPGGCSPHRTPAARVPAAGRTHTTRPRAGRPGPTAGPGTRSVPPGGDPRQPGSCPPIRTAGGSVEALDPTRGPAGGH